MHLYIYGRFPRNRRKISLKFESSYLKINNDLNKTDRIHKKIINLGEKGHNKEFLKNNHTIIPHNENYNSLLGNFPQVSQLDQFSYEKSFSYDKNKKSFQRNENCLYN
jgi:t-SNARE complex subunit (syntaxin)